MAASIARAVRIRSTSSLKAAKASLMGFGRVFSAGAFSVQVLVDQDSSFLSRDRGV